MIHRTAKLALLVALVAPGLSPLATSAQQRESKQEAAAHEAGAKRASRKEAARGKTAAEPVVKERMSITPEREAAVMTFVKRNHAELAELLAHLKENQPKEYERAVRELFRTSERLTLIHDRDRDQYDLEVRLWKTQSRIQLLTARLKMGESEDLRRELRELLGEQIDNRAALLRHDRERVAARLTKIEADLKRLEDDRDKVIDRQMQSLAGGKAQKPTAKAEARRKAKNASKDSIRSSDSPTGSKAAD